MVAIRLWQKDFRSEVRAPRSSEYIISHSSSYPESRKRTQRFV
jgi:hypothetical protein